MAPQLLPSRFRLSQSGPAAAGALLAGLLLGGMALLPSPGLARPVCRFLMPIGGSGEPTVQKRISAARLVGRTNWNTDFAVDRSYRSYRVNFQSVSTDRGTFPLAVFLRFTDGSNLQVVNDTLTLDPQQSRRLGPFSAVPGKRTSLVNVRVGSSAIPKSTGFSYRVSVEGCE